MSNLDEMLKLAEDNALNCVGMGDFPYNNDQLVDAFGMIKKIMLQVDAIAEAQAKAEAEAEWERARLEAEAEAERVRLEAEAAEEWFLLVDDTFKACPSRFLWKRGKTVLMVVASNKSTSDAAEAEFAQQLASLGEVTRYLNSQTMGDTEVFYTSVDLKSLKLPRNLNASDYGGVYHRVTAGLASVLRKS